MGTTRVGEAGSIAAVSLAFRRVVDIPVETFVVGLQNWERTGQERDLHIGAAESAGRLSTTRTRARADSKSAWPRDGFAHRCA
jgi:hypothetical protein